jgi:hypothetical protein
MESHSGRSVPAAASEKGGDDMITNDTSSALARVFEELSAGADPVEGFVLNHGDVGLLHSLEKLSAADASRNINGGATIAAHAEHLRYGLSLWNRWASDGGTPFAGANWGAAWQTSSVDEPAWREIRDGLRNEAQRWLEALKSPREASGLELTGMIASVVHLAYHLGAIRQIDKGARGPREDTPVS